MDDNNYHNDYDFVICGTGLGQSILSSALARSNDNNHKQQQQQGVSTQHNKIIQFDGNDFYGELDTVWTFASFLEFYKKNHHDDSAEESAEPELSTSISSVKPNITTTTTTAKNSTIIPLQPKGSLHTLTIHSMNITHFPRIQKGSRLRTPYGPGRWVMEDNDTMESSNNNTRQNEYTSLKIELLSHEATPHSTGSRSANILYVALPNSLFSIHNAQSLEDYLQETHGIHLVFQADDDTIPDDNPQMHDLLLQNQHRIMLDLTPSLLFSSGTAVQALLTSQVADYLEFKAMEALLYTTQLEKVPCSKNDVFASKTLTPLHKRKIMKFLQLAMDYGVTLQEQEQDEKEGPTTDKEDAFSDNNVVQTLNERHLNQGRSLARPQNKQIQSTELTALQESLSDDFTDYLLTKVKLSDTLIKLVKHTLCLEQDSAQVWTVRDGMERLCRHVLALGRYGKTAFLAPMYGSGEFAQAFCRSAAVYGTTYVLRTSPIAIESNEEGSVSGVVVRDNETGEQRTVNCQNVILPSDILINHGTTGLGTQRRVLRRIGIYKGKFVTNATGEQRHVIILPPSSSIGNESTIQGLVMDESLCTAPSGCSIVHLTTIIEVKDGESTSDLAIFDRAMQEILQSCEKSDIQQLFETTMSYAIPVPTTKDFPRGVYALDRPYPGLTVDEVFEYTETIFKEICPTEGFLSLSKAVEEAIKEHLGGSATRNEIDDEQLVLESAVNLLNKRSESCDTELDELDLKDQS